MPRYYGMHDAPGGRQKHDSFQRIDGTPLQPGDEKKFNIPWGFLNPYLEAMMLKEGFIIDGEYTQTPDYKKLDEILKRNIRYLKSNPMLERWLNNEEHVVNSRNKLNQAYKAISMKAGDIVYVRGKKGILSEGWLFEVIDMNIEYILKNNKYEPNIKFKTICKVSNDNYLKIQALRASFWNINDSNEREIISGLI
tara:strand:- start:169 stop:753 length:585 start_codon:yes stop_codon:yes gene_type:complete